MQTLYLLFFVQKQSVVCVFFHEHNKLLYVFLLKNTSVFCVFRNKTLLFHVSSHNKLFLELIFDDICKTQQKLKLHVYIKNKRMQHHNTDQS